MEAIEKVERREQGTQDIADHENEVSAESKGCGFKQDYRIVV
ncbi:GapR family DNA-binding domain-containing protein [Pontibaca salina]|uniref:DUF2312 domain-containing protein n=1 Tax=Pontibaca salina TaxID=2795731 RepID=A0A934HNH4_9RHOB|nr:DUF2312 domain-containing protein [Pontibaca salina]